MGDNSGSMLGRDLEGLIDRARSHKKEMGDSFVSVEHLVLGFIQDKRFGQQLYKEFQLTPKSLHAAIQAIRGTQKVVDQGSHLTCHASERTSNYDVQFADRGVRICAPDPEGKYEALEKYGKDLTEMARQGKLDPVIGRDDEIRRSIQILSRRTKNNPVLIGEPGVGKTAISEG